MKPECADVLQCTRVVLDALDLRYREWRARNAEIAACEDTLKYMDRTHEDVINYIQGMLLSPDYEGEKRLDWYGGGDV